MADYVVTFTDVDEVERTYTPSEIPRATLDAKFLDLDIAEHTLSAFSFDSSDVEFYSTTIKAITLGSGYKFVAPEAFSKFEFLKVANLPGVLVIGDHAFANCEALVRVAAPAVVALDEGAFYGCERLEDLLFGSVQYISESVFGRCFALRQVDISQVTIVRDGAFSLCSSLVSVSLTQAEWISSGAFSECTALVSVTAPKLRYLYSWAFSSCTSLRYVDFPQLVDITDFAFYRCVELRQLVFPAVQTITNMAFGDCFNLYTLSLPSIAKIHRAAFDDCSSLVSITNLPTTFQPTAEQVKSYVTHEKYYEPDRAPQPTLLFVYADSTIKEYNILDGSASRFSGPTVPNRRALSFFVAPGEDRQRLQAAALALNRTMPRVAANEILQSYLGANFKFLPGGVDFTVRVPRRENEDTPPLGDVAALEY